MTRRALQRRLPRTPSVVSAGPMLSDFDRLFRDELFRPATLLGRMMGENLQGATGWLPAVDVRETESSFDFTVDLPGLTREDIEITVENNLLTLSGERKFEEEAKGESYHRVERAYGSFTRSFTLPREVDQEKVDASFNNGVLTISVPKTEKAKPRRIEIH